MIAFAQYGVEFNPSTEPASTTQTRGSEAIVLTTLSVGNQTGNHFDAKIIWTPADLGEPNKFHIEIFDARQLEPRSALAVRYDIKIYQGDKYLRLPRAPLGLNEAVQNEDFSHDYTFVFLKGGSYVPAIEEIEHEGENITIPIQVTPEFPPVIVALLVTSAGLTIAVMYGRRTMTWELILYSCHGIYRFIRCSSQFFIYY